LGNELYVENEREERWQGKNDKQREKEEWTRTEGMIGRKGNSTCSRGNNQGHNTPAGEEGARDNETEGSRITNTVESYGQKGAGRR
jgi:hypothetical protein